MLFQMLVNPEKIKCMYFRPRLIYFFISIYLPLLPVMAKQAGSISVALLCGMGTECHLRAAEPDHIFSSLKEFADCLVELGTQSEPCEGEGGARALIKKGTLIPEREEKPWGIRHKQGVDQ